MNMKFQKISRTTSITGDAWGRRLPADRLRRRLLLAIAAAPLLVGMPAEAGEGGGEAGADGETAANRSSPRRTVCTAKEWRG